MCTWSSSRARANSVSSPAALRPDIEAGLKKGFGFGMVGFVGFGVGFTKGSAPEVALTQQNPTDLGLEGGFLIVSACLHSDIVG